MPTVHEVADWWHGNPDHGLALICGGVSGNLEMLEAEGRAFADPGVLLKIIEKMDEVGAGPIWDLLTGPEGYAEDSPSGGMHLLYRIVDQSVPGNVKIARRMATPEELAENPLDKIKVLAETRGQGGYVIVAPTSGTCHKSGQPWHLVNGNYGRLPQITWAQRNLLHRALFLALDEMPVQVAETLPVVVPSRHEVQLTAISPGDDFERRTDWSSILVPHGWQPGIRLNNGERNWTRPGKSFGDGISATTGRANDRDRLYVFSTSTVFEAEVPYTKFGAYALLNHGGDHRAAAQTLVRHGYGERREIVDIPLGEFVPAEDPQAPIETESYTCDDVGNGQRLMDRTKGTYRYVYEEKLWYRYDGKMWGKDVGGALEREFMAITEDMLRSDEEEIRKWGKRSRSRERIKAALAVCQNLFMTYSSTEWAPVRHLVNVDNGVLNLKEGTLAEHHPKHLMTHTLGTAYQPEATCPNFTRFMAKAIPDEEMRAYVQRALGYSLLGDASQRSIFLIYGPSGTGKSTLIETMRHVFGDYGATAGSGAFRSNSGQGGQGPSADLHMLRGRRFVTTSETSDNVTFDEDLLKRISGRDRVISRGLYQEPVEWVPELTLWIATNNPPKFSSDDDAIWRRTKLIPFTTVFRGEEEIPDYARTSLYHEAPGILAWLLAGLRDYQVNGLAEPGDIQALATQQRQDSDSVSRFVEDKLAEGALVVGPGNSMGLTVLYGLYMNWVRGTGERGLGSRRFALRLESGYPAISRPLGQQSWLGIGPSGNFLGLS